MSDAIHANPPNKRQKQTSILDFITVSTKQLSNCVNEAMKASNTAHNSDTNGEHLRSELVVRQSVTPVLAIDSSSQSDASIDEQNTTNSDNECQIVQHSSQLSPQLSRRLSLELSCDLSEVPETDFSEDSDSESETASDTIDAFDSLYRMPHCLLPLSSLKPDSTRFLLIRVPLMRNCVPKPYPSNYTDKWDSKSFLKMPCSPLNQISGFDNSVRNRYHKWTIIEKTLLKSEIKSSRDLEAAIKSYNPFMVKYNFNALHCCFDECEPHERNQFFNSILPQFIDLTLLLPSIVTQSIPLLKHRLNATLFLSQYQIASLLANAFFSTFPKRSKFNGEFRNYPTINFFSLFTNDNTSEYPKAKVEKLKCIMNYFRRVLKETPKGIVSFERRCLEDEELPNWSQSSKELRNLCLLSDGLIEREGAGLLQIDFANKMVGGGVLGSGCVQEEIRFAICPELIVARLFTEKLDDNEVLIVKGCEQYSSYAGYGNTFEWCDDFVDTTEKDEWERKYTTVVVMDALYFSYERKHIQYEIEMIDRELTKAYCGFMERRQSNAKNKCAVASGNWGCGAFNGDPLLKAVIQLMAASQADRDLVLFTFNDIGLKLQLERLYSFVTRNKFTVSHLYRSLQLYGQYILHSKTTHKTNLIDYIRHNKQSIFDEYC